MFRSIALLSCVVLAAACGGSAGDDADDGDADTAGDSDQQNGDGATNGDGSTAGDIDATDDEGPGAVAGNGICESLENASTTPQDCPPVAGDGYCSTPEDAETTPQDCPAIAGDGLCTHDETFITVPDDCPPPDFTYTGGGVAALLAASPPLRFGKLTIQGTLVLAPETTTMVEARVFALTGRIESSYGGSCDQRHAPGFIVTGAETAIVSGVVSLPGQPGQNIGPSTVNCRCQGSNGGRFELDTDSLSFSGEIYMPGGRGSQITYDVNNESGCTGGSGGTFRVYDSALRIGHTYSGKLNLNGGRGGNDKTIVPPNGIISIVEGGAAGVFTTNTTTLTFQEHSPHASRQDAQVIGVKAVVNGLANNSTDNVVNNTTDQTIFIKSPKTSLLGSSAQDNIEDLYRVRNPGPSARAYTIRLNYAAGSGSADLDLFVLDRTSSTILAASDQNSGANESATVTVQPNTEIIIGVSVFMSGQRYYTLRVE